MKAVGPLESWICNLYKGFFGELYMGVSKNRGFCPPKSSILKGFSIINHPFWDTPIFGNTHIFQMQDAV